MILVRLLCLFSIIFSLQVNHLRAESHDWYDEILAATGCCKVCSSKSQACGDSCISKDFNCSKGSGCACDSSGINNGGSNNSDDSSKKKKKKKKGKVKCPAIIADVEFGTYETRANYECYGSKASAERKGYLAEDEVEQAPAS